MDRVSTTTQPRVARLTTVMRERELPSLATAAIVTAVLAAVVVFETLRFAELRDRLRHQVAQEH
jgi:hypothetical protein